MLKEDELRLNSNGSQGSSKRQMLDIKMPAGITRNTLETILLTCYGGRRPPNPQELLRMETELILLRAMAEEWATKREITQRVMGDHPRIAKEEIIQWAWSCLLPPVPNRHRRNHDRVRLVEATADIRSYMRWLVDHPLFSDVAFTIDGNSIHAHKAILVLLLSPHSREELG